jgi:hypothetical protein
MGRALNAQLRTFKPNRLCLGGMVVRSTAAAARLSTTIQQD